MTDDAQRSDPVDGIMEPGGVLSRTLDGYEARQQQLEMARAVHRTIGAAGRLVVEAPTGTGKTLAYLIPALLAGKKVVVSTATKALQEQIFDKDVPFLEGLMAKLDPPVRFKAVNIKGRTNYLCLYRFENREALLFRTKKDLRLFKKVERWAKSTKTGDRAEIEGLPDDYAAWSQVTATGQQCHGSECKHYEDCFVTAVRRRAREADLVLVNHHLFFADLALRSNTAAEILPAYEAVVFDEAHHLESTATAHFGIQVSNYRFDELFGDIRRALQEEDALTEVGEDKLADAEAAADELFGAVGTADGRNPLAEVVEGPRKEEVAEARKGVVESLEALRGWVEKADAGDVVVRLAERCTELCDDVAFVCDCGSVGYVYVVEKRGRGVFVEAAPIDVASIFAERVLRLPAAQIYTSATLTVDKSFDYFLRRLGMDGRDDVETLHLGAVFDYSSRAVVYIPRRLPTPNDPAFIDGVCQIVEYLVGLTSGRAFVLFTSYRNMELVYDRLQDSLDYPVLKQGDAPKRQLLEEFRSNAGSVLFATNSFWEGVDVEGDALSLVIIDKLPFANPRDPLVEARMKLLESKGGDSFMDFSVPAAAISLKQGFGRLIRSHRDQGIVAILDSRIGSKRYGRIFLESLPPAPVVWNAREARDWWRANVGDDKA